MKMLLPWQRFHSIVCTVFESWNDSLKKTHLWCVIRLALKITFSILLRMQLSKNSAFCLNAKTLTCSFLGCFFLIIIIFLQYLFYFPIFLWFFFFPLNFPQITPPRKKLKYCDIWTKSEEYKLAQCQALERIAIETKKHQLPPTLQKN